MTRIYRDVRRVKYGGLYKNHLWLALRHPGEEEAGRPCFYFEIYPEGYEYGMGYYCPRPVQMEQYRRRIRRDPKPLEQLARKLEGQELFHLEGEEYKRSKGECPQLLKPWFNRKNITLCTFRQPDGRMTTPELREDILAGFRWLKPYYHYFKSLELEPPVSGPVSEVRQDEAPGRSTSGRFFVFAYLQNASVTSTMCSAHRPNCLSRSAAGPEWPNSSLTPMRLTGTGQCSATQELTASPRPPMMECSSTVTILPQSLAAASTRASSRGLMVRHVDDPGVDALGGQGASRLGGLVDHQAGGDDGHVAALLEHLRPCRSRTCSPSPWKTGAGKPGEAHVDRAAHAGRRPGRRLSPPRRRRGT